MLHFSYVLPIVQCYKQRTVEVLLQSIQSTQIIPTIHALQLSIFVLQVKWSVRFAFTYFQHVTQCYEQRTVGKALLQSIQSPWKIWMIAIYKHREAMYRTTAN